MTYSNMEEAQKIHSGMFRKYWHGDNPIWDSWHVMDSPIGKDEEGKVASLWVIKGLLDKGYRVKAGYLTCDIRGFHQFFILYKKPFDPILNRHKKNLKNYGHEVCEMAYNVNRRDGEGVNTIGHCTGYTTKQVDAQINAYSAIYMEGR